MDKNLTDNEIKKALDYWKKFDKEIDEMLSGRYKGDKDLIKQKEIVKITFEVFDLINRKDADIEWLRTCNDGNLDSINKLVELNNQLKAENERLKNAYKQCAWERDIFAEDMTQEIKKDCSYLMLDIKTIKSEAYKEFAERLKKQFSLGKKECRKFLDNDGAFAYDKARKIVDNLLKELVGEDNESKN